MATTARKTPVRKTTSAATTTTPRKTATAKVTASAPSTKTEMVLVKETKGTFVYGDDTDGTFIPTLYIRKGAFPNGAPASITVTVA